MAQTPEYIVHSEQVKGAFHKSLLQEFGSIIHLANVLGKAGGTLKRKDQRRGRELLKKLTRYGILEMKKPDVANKPVEADKGGDASHLPA